ncbi:MAG: bifunctional glycosyltransferase family 2/GtrA family protein [Bacilli bacterium]|nr:bifunctional glycosyltransferase family 2/GtrA family protein [Bacilli bacterium]
MRKTALLIPIYEPEELCLGFLSLFKKEDFDYFLIVDDGSGEKYQEAFKSFEEKTVFKVIGYPVNKGKGHALKHGIQYLRDLDPEISLIVTADGDGQHAYEDILRVKETGFNNPGSLVLGSRLFDKKRMPLTSRVGNWYSSVKFRLLTKKKVRDTQTGLRAISSELFPLALSTPGNRYDYEEEFLTEAVRDYPLIQVDIEAIYLNENKSSHFRPVIDSILINKRIFLYVLASVLSWGVDLGLFYLFSNHIFVNNAETQVYVSTILARVASGAVNFFLLFFFVFDKRENMAMKLLKYFSLFLVNMGLSSTLTYLFRSMPANLTFVKLIVDTAIAIANYFINRLWVFSRKKSKKNKVARCAGKNITNLD